MKTLRTCVLFCAAVILSSAIVADDELDNRLVPAVRKIADEAKVAKLEKLLVFIREDASNRGDLDTPAILKAIRNTIDRALTANDLKLVTSTEANNLAASQKTKRLMSPAEVKKLNEIASFDGVVSVNYKFRDTNVWIRLALLSQSERLLVRNVKLRKKPTPKTASPAKSTAPRPTGTTAGSRNNNRRVAPPLVNGFSGYRRQWSEKERETRQKTDGLESPNRKPNDRESRAGKDREARKEQDQEESGGDREGAGGNGKDREDSESAKDREESDRESDQEGEGGEFTKSQKDVNRRILDFATSNIGRKVGNGECWTLAAEALDYAGAVPPNLYDFGQEISLRQLQPGDVLQFRSARFEEANYWAQLGVPDHTAIVYSTKGSKTFILHQNFGKKIVTILDIDFSNMVSGNVQAYRAIPRGSNQRRDLEAERRDNEDRERKE